MRVLLDECLPRRLKHELAGHEAKTRTRDGLGQQEKWRAARLAAADFDVFVTADRNLSYQQDVFAFDIAVIVLAARSNSIDELRPLTPRVLEVIVSAQRGAVTVVRA